MPNTLCHIAIQGPISHKVFSLSSFLWILLGLVIPDLPWIWLHILQPMDIFPIYQLRLYITAQASLLFCLFICGAIALTVNNSKKVFLILAVNCLFHLLLDSLQIKWGNGVNIIAPFDWSLYSAALVWPWNMPTQILTWLGLAYFLFYWKKAATAVRNEYQLTLPKGWRLPATALLLAAFFFGPFLFFQSMLDDNTYNLGTFTSVDDRRGKSIGLDRAGYDADSKEIIIFSGERFTASGELPTQSGKVSFKGHFLDNHSIQSEKFHVHKGSRDPASKIGLILTCAFLFYTLLLPLFSKKRTINP